MPNSDPVGCGAEVPLPDMPPKAPLLAILAGETAARRRTGGLGFGAGPGQRWDGVSMDLKQLDESDEITMRTMRRDGSWSSRPIWIVVVNDEPYVRSANGAS